MIYVIGDSFIDRYTWGVVTRISPDAPVPVILVEREEERPGGAANVANTIQELSGESCFLMESVSDRIVKHRILANGHHFSRIDYDTKLKPIDTEPIDDMVEPGDIVVLMDYGKGSLAHVAKLVAAAKGAGATVLVDPKGHDWGRYAGCDLIKPNRDEVRELVGGWSSARELITKLKPVIKKLKIPTALVTLANEGMVLVRPGLSLSIPPRPINAVCHSGAGEAAIAALAVALDEGWDYYQAAEYAARAGEAACKQFGTVVVKREEVFGDPGADRSSPTLTLTH